MNVARTGFFLFMTPCLVMRNISATKQPAIPEAMTQAAKTVRQVSASSQFLSREMSYARFEIALGICFNSPSHCKCASLVAH